MENTDELKQEEIVSSTVETSSSSDEITTPETKESKPSRFKILLERFKKFARTRKGKVVIGFSCLVFVLVIVGIGFVVYSLVNKSEPEVKIAENIASDKIYDNYDYIYNSSDNKLIASTIDKVKQLEIVSGEEKIMDYIISPDKKKIAYSLAPTDYKNRIKAVNIPDLTNLKFEPVAFKVYELNFETGENKLIWETNEYQLGATRLPIYKQKEVVYPDSYVTAYHW